MAEAVTVEELNVAEAMGREGMSETTGKLLSAIEENPVVSKLLNAAETIEDAYDVVKNYVVLKFEDFKVLFNKTMDYFKESKMALDDKVLDNVAGGGWFSDIWNKYKKEIVCAVIVIGCTAVGALAGPYGTAAGLAIGVAAAATVYQKF